MSTSLPNTSLGETAAFSMKAGTLQESDHYDTDTLAQSLPVECGAFDCFSCGERIEGLPYCHDDEPCALFRHPLLLGCLQPGRSWAFYSQVLCTTGSSCQECAVAEGSCYGAWPLECSSGEKMKLPEQDDPSSNVLTVEPRYDALPPQSSSDEEAELSEQDDLSSCNSATSQHGEQSDAETESSELDMIEAREETDEGRRMLALQEAMQVLRENSQTELNIHGILLGRRIASVGQFADALAFNSSVTLLNLCCNRLDENGIVFIADVLKKNNTIRVLNLKGNNLRATGARLLALGLGENDTLASLDLSGNGLGDAGAISFAEALGSNESLTALTLRCNAITSRGAERLLQILIERTSVTRLGIEGSCRLGTAMSEMETRTQDMVNVALRSKRPCMVVTPVCSHDGQISYMTMAGARLISCSATQQVLDVLEALSRHTGLEKEDLRFVSMEGEVIPVADAALITMHELLGCSCSSFESAVPSETTMLPSWRLHTSIASIPRRS